MSTPTGFRAMTPGIHNALLLAEQWGTQTAVGKERALLAFNKVAKIIGVSAQGRELINMIVSFTRECDWDGDSRPLAWPDNQRLMDQTGLSLAALKRNLRALAEAGLISFKDSPNGRRVGRRNPHTGKIELERSYGLDLSPLGIRTPQLECIAEEERHRVEYTRRLAHQFTCHRKRLTSILEAASEHEMPGPWHSCAVELAELATARRGRCDTAQLASLCDRIAAVLERAQTAYSAAVDRYRTRGASGQCSPQEASRAQNGSFNMNMGPLGHANEPLIQNTKEKKICPLYKNERGAAGAAQLSLIEAGAAGKEGFGNQPEGEAPPEQPDTIGAKPIDLATIRTLCPDFWQWVYAKNGVATWDDVIAAASGMVRAALEIPEATWRTAARLLGRETAAVAVALIFEKHAEGIIETPGAYLNGMVKKAAQQNLHLPSSLFHWRSPRKRTGSRSTRMN